MYKINIDIETNNTAEISDLFEVIEMIIQNKNEDSGVFRNFYYKITIKENKNEAMVT